MVWLDDRNINLEMVRKSHIRCNSRKNLEIENIILRAAQFLQE